MALSPDDPCGGFQHDRVMAFINEKMAGHVKGLEFYQNNMALSWEEVEDKLSTILEDSEVPSQAKEACTWGTLALGVRFAHRQEQLQARRVQWLRDFAKLHKSAAQALASDLRELTIQKEMEHRDAAFQLQMVQNSLTEVQKERDLLRWKLLQAELGYSRQQEQAVVAASRAETYRAGEKEEDARAWTRAIIAAAVAAGDAEGGEEERDAEAGAFSTEAPQELDGGFLQYLGVGGQREGDLRSVATASYPFCGIQEPQATASLEPLPVQLPASFTYSYSCPLSSFSEGPSPSPPTVPATVPNPPHWPPNWGACNTSMWSDVGEQGTDSEELQRERRDHEPQQQRRPPIFRRPGDWDCPWCKAVNFSRREICYRCGKGIWLQSPQ
ncbi:testis-expressed protein 13B [Otolemur garnettii]|uniref:testis-expressed protein 13B n=1 Tax=Otolemur garnettii TaxID=30611 RepID=UPI000C7ECE4E|nr:testis-expressed protein 13B [Otolemur garnettii]